ncbi:putative ferric reductase transmembrane component [Candida viswanathii]|uniref:ferric-chelate reductase (NADPH) n=1 Tax=Candida viswanathii TaxID=5486 RepID=A0A367YHC6_9ASCO|nr:putative ferric reductase transmembrane component [Candida viswanathii]
MLFTAFCVIVSYLSAFAIAHGAKFQIYGSGLVYSACNYQTTQSATFCANGLKSLACLCSNKKALATLVGCMTYDNRNTSHAVDLAQEYCEKYGNVTLPDDWFEESYEYFLDNAVDPSSIPNFNVSVPIDVPIKLNTTEISLYYDGYVQFLGNYDNSFYYGAGALGYWLLVMVVEGVINWTKVLFPSFVKRLTFAPITWWRQYVSMPATFRKRKAQEMQLLKIFDCLIPSRYETLVLIGFYAYIIAIHCIKLHYVEGVPIFDSKHEFLLRVIADRTGIIATVMMPLVFLFGGRNNIMQWLTGMSYNKFMTYHRHIARVMFMLIVIHAVNFTILEGTYYSTAVKETYFHWGIIALVSGGIIMIQGLLFLRRSWYEIFLLIHILMAGFWIGGAWVHVDDLGYVWFCYATAAPWIFDRAVRIGRLVVFGFPKAQVTLLANETLRVVVPRPSYWKSIPGGHAFIHFIRPSCFWQNHPFTFVDTPDGKNIVLYCKVKGGMTHGLYQYLAQLPGQSASITVTIEGPYGEATPARYADTAVFVAGGNGIPGIYSEVMDMARRLPADSKQIMRLIWVIRDYHSLEWFQDELEYLKNTNIHTTVYVTRPTLCLGTDDDKKIGEKDSCDDDKASIKSRLSHIEFREGRPCIAEIVADEIADSCGAVAFVSCGHPVMVDEVRYFTAQSVSNPEHKRVDFFEQLQVWA